MAENLTVGPRSQRVLFQEKDTPLSMSREGLNGAWVMQVAEQLRSQTELEVTSEFSYCRELPPLLELKEGLQGPG